MTAKLSTNITDTSPAAAGTVIGPSVAGLDRFDTWAMYATLTGATGGTLDVYLECSFDGGTTWYEFGHFPQMLAGASTATFAVPCCFQVPVSSGSLAVAKGTSGSAGVLQLDADAYVRGPIGNLVRAVYVAGAGTSAGGAVSIDFIGFDRP